jgi:hypothetical protein
MKNVVGFWVLKMKKAVGFWVLKMEKQLFTTYLNE